MKLEKLIKEIIKEYNNYDYPLGADADPKAPWNQDDTPEYDSFDIIKNSNNIVNFIVELHDTSNGIKKVSLENMLISTKANEDDYAYFDWALEQNPKPEGFLKKLDDLCRRYSPNIEFNYSDNDF